MCMKNVEIREIEARDYAEVLRINESVVDTMSPMDSIRLGELLSYCSYAKVALVDGKIAKFILAMKEGGRYQNENYTWFSERYETFLYVDRVAVSPEYIGQGVVPVLYRNLLEYARANSTANIVFEINIIPLNEQSVAFHKNSDLPKLANRKSQAEKQFQCKHANWITAIYKPV